MNLKDELFKTGLGLLTLAIVGITAGTVVAFYHLTTTYLPDWAQIGLFGSIIVLVLGNVLGSIFYEVEGR